jgi:hypothetical protein
MGMIRQTITEVPSTTTWCYDEPKSTNLPPICHCSAKRAGW